MKALDSTPKKDGFHMPGEFEEHEGCWMVWPERPDNWRLGAKPAQEQYTNVAKAIAEFEPLTVAVSSAQYDNARYHLPENIQVVEIENDDAWIRDTGATIVKKGKEIRGVDWRFNAWGGLVDGLYFPWDKDDALARKMCEILEIDYYRLADFVLEGGSIHVDGEGTLVVTEECLLSPGRNPQLSKAEIEDVLTQYLNVEKIIWLKRGIYHDETTGHVDNIFNFVKPGVVVLAWTDDEDDPQYEISQEDLRILEAATDAKGRKLEIHKMHIPAIPITITKEESLGVDVVDGTLPREEGDRQAASYCNYYTANGGIVFPLFDDVNDAKAEALLKELYPDRKVVGVRAREIILGGGNIHCITQQVPKRG